MIKGKSTCTVPPPINSWIYVSDLPTPQSGRAVAVLSSTRILVIGGWDGDKRVYIVYKGMLTCATSIVILSTSLVVINGLP